MAKPILCLDFDGVIHSYSSGWKGADVVPDPPVPGVLSFIARATEHFEVHIFSSRSNQKGGIDAMRHWLDSWAMRERVFDTDVLDSIKYPTEKPPAMITIDDRALTFNGQWSDYDPQRLLQFQPWNKRDDLIMPPVMPMVRVPDA